MKCLGCHPAGRRARIHLRTGGRRRGEQRSLLCQPSCHVEETFMGGDQRLRPSGSVSTRWNVLQSNMRSGNLLVQLMARCTYFERTLPLKEVGHPRNSCPQWQRQFLMSFELNICGLKEDMDTSMSPYGWVCGTRPGPRAGLFSSTIPVK